MRVDNFKLKEMRNLIGLLFLLLCVSCSNKPNETTVDKYYAYAKMKGVHERIEYAADFPKDWTFNEWKLMVDKAEIFYLAEENNKEKYSIDSIIISELKKEIKLAGDDKQKIDLIYNQYAEQYDFIHPMEGE